MNLSAIIPLGLLFMAPGSTSFQSLWLDRWGALAAAVLVAWMWARFYRTPLYPWALTYLIATTCIQVFHPTTADMVSGALLTDVQEAAGQGLICLIAFLAFVYLPYGRSRLPRWQLLVGVPLALSIFVAGKPGIQVPWLSNPSMAGVLVALCLAPEAWGWSLLGLAAILWTGRHTPLAVWGVTALWAVPRGRWQYKAILTGVVAAAMYALQWGHLDPGRLAVWHQVWNFFWDLPWQHQFLGLGLGTGHVWVPMIQMLQVTDGTPSEYYLWAHNDWLQLTLETGLVGLVLAVTCAIELWREASERNRAIILGFAVAMCADFPLHWPLHALVIWQVCRDEI